MYGVAIFLINVAFTASLFPFSLWAIGFCTNREFFFLILYNVYNSVEKVGMKFAL